MCALVDPVNSAGRVDLKTGSAALEVATACRARFWGVSQHSLAGRLQYPDSWSTARVSSHASLIATRRRTSSGE